MRAGVVLLQRRARRSDVVGERVGEQERLLRHEADDAAQIAQRDVADIAPVDEHRSSRRVLQRGSRFTSVDLPDPVAPTIATVSPAFTVNETSVSTSESHKEAEVPNSMLP